jgi:mutator protein MutT
VRDATLCFLIRGDPPAEILLGFKKAGFGVGKYNGFGGGIEIGETVAEATVREVREEIGVKIDEGDLQYAGQLTFEFPANPDWNQKVYVYLTRTWDGEPVESTEMTPSWFAVEDIPYERMWEDDSHWLPRVLAGERIRGWFSFREDNETVAASKVEAWEEHHA